MFLTTAIDDTNIGTIRRSIFFYASLIVAVFYFDLEVDLGNLPGGFESTNGYGVTSAGVSIVAILVQLYSLARLALARPIAIAKLSKAWTEKDSEAFDSDRHDLKSLISQLEQCAKSPYPTVEHLVQFENHLQSLGQQKDKHQSSRERLSNLVSGLERKIDDIERSQSRLEHGFAEILRPKERPTDPERQKIMQASFPKGGESVVDGNTFEGSSAALLQQDFSEIVAEFRLTIRSPDYLGGLKAIQDQAEQEIVENYDDQKELSEQFKNFKQFLEYCRNLDDLPEVQPVRELLENLNGNLVRARRLRAREFNWFEFWLPVGVCAVSIGAGICTFLGRNGEGMQWAFGEATSSIGYQSLFTAGWTIVGPAFGMGWLNQL